MSPCKGIPLTAPTFIDQNYYIRNVLGDYDAPAFPVDPVCGETVVTYTNSVTGPNFITGVSDNLGDGKLVGWYSADEVDIGNYIVTINAATTCQSGSKTYQLDVYSACKVQNL